MVEEYFWRGEAERGPFYALPERGAAGHRWVDKVMLWDFGSYDMRKLQFLDLDIDDVVGVLRNIRPHRPYWPHRPLPGVYGPWLVANPTGETLGEFGRWEGGSVYDEPILNPGRNEPDVHRRFAKLKTRAGILRFADKYGLLDGGYTCVVRLSDELPPHAEVTRTGWARAELLGHWRHEVAEMARLLQFWDWIRDEREDQLRRYIHWQRSPRRVEMVLVVTPEGSLLPFSERIAYEEQLGTPYWLTIAREGDAHGDTLLDLWPYGDVIAPAFCAVARLVNKRLAGQVNPRVRIDGGGIYFHPDSLFASLYTSLALELVGKEQRAMCARETCGRYFIVRHKRQKYCDDDCRKRAFDERKQRQRAENGAVANVANDVAKPADAGVSH